MAPVPKNASQRQNLSSHSHKNHPLTHHSDEAAYVCDACKTPGSGARFRCHACHVDIHVYCADCPQKLSSFLHTHPLALVFPQPQPAGASHSRRMRICDVCREATEGQLYRCKDCQFHVHPLCTHLPEKVRHVIDPNHRLRLRKVPSRSGRCAVCRTDCSSMWVYGCDACKLNIHLKCVQKPCGSGGSGSHSSGRSRGIQHQHQHQHAASSGSNLAHAYYAWGYPNYPNYHFGYPYYSGPVQFPHNNNLSHLTNHAPSSSSSLGSLFGNTMFSVVGDLALGALTNFIFGSIGF